jgi:hypothetical protein
LCKVKGKVHPRTGHEGPEGEYRYSSTLSLTLALDEGGWSTPRPGRFTPGKETQYCVVYDILISGVVKISTVNVNKALKASRGQVSKAELTAT